MSSTGIQAIKKFKTHRCQNKLYREAAQAQCRIERDGGSAVKGHRPLVNSP